MKQFRWIVMGTVLLLSSCANLGVATPLPPTDPFMTRRWLFLAIALLILIAEMILQWRWRMNKVGVYADRFIDTIPPSWISTFVGLLIGIPLLWTKLGEWGYLIALFLFARVPPIMIVIAFLNGLVNGTIWLVLIVINVGFVFPTPALFYALVIPCIVGLAVRIFVVFKFGPLF